ncbi:MAG: hypothetical protein RLN62_05515 [Rickettsiales bacterium]
MPKKLSKPSEIKKELEEDGWGNSKVAIEDGLVTITITDQDELVREIKSNLKLMNGAYRVARDAVLASIIDELARHYNINIGHEVVIKTTLGDEGKFAVYKRKFAPGYDVIRCDTPAAPEGVKTSRAFGEAMRGVLGELVEEGDTANPELAAAYPQVRGGPSLTAMDILLGKKPFLNALGADDQVEKLLKSAGSSGYGGGAIRARQIAKEKARERAVEEARQRAAEEARQRAAEEAEENEGKMFPTSKLGGAPEFKEPESSDEEREEEASGNRESENPAAGALTGVYDDGVGVEEDDDEDGFIADHNPPSKGDVESSDQGEEESSKDGLMSTLKRGFKKAFGGKEPVHPQADKDPDAQDATAAKPEDGNGLGDEEGLVTTTIPESDPELQEALFASLLSGKDAFIAPGDGSHTG